jgi:hypothetical protein
MEHVDRCGVYLVNCADHEDLGDFPQREYVSRSPTGRVAAARQLSSRVDVAILTF